MPSTRLRSARDLQCAIDLQCFVLLSSTGWRLSVSQVKRLAVAAYLVAALATVAVAMTVLPLVKEMVMSSASAPLTGWREHLELLYVGANAYVALALIARETLTRRQALPSGADRVDFMRGLDMSASHVLTAYLLSSVLPVLALVVGSDVLFLSILGPTLQVSPLVGVGQLVLLPLTGATVVVSVVARNAARTSTTRPLSAARLATLTPAVVICGSGLQSLLLAFSSNADHSAAVGYLETGVRGALLPLEVSACAVALTLLLLSLRRLRRAPFPCLNGMNPSCSAGHLVSERGPERSLPRVLHGELTGSAYGGVVQRLLLAAYLLTCLTGGMWAVRHGPGLAPAGLRGGTERVLVYATYLSAIAMAELVLLGAGPQALHRQLRFLWEAGARVWSIAGWTVSYYVVATSTIVGAFAATSLFLTGEISWATIAIAPTIMAAALAGQALGGHEPSEATAGNGTSASAAVISLVLSVPCLYFTLHSSSLALLGALCYASCLVWTALLAVRRGILVRA
jgi:hypothetical protein